MEKWLAHCIKRRALLLRLRCEYIYVNFAYFNIKLHNLLCCKIKLHTHYTLSNFLFFEIVVINVMIGSLLPMNSLISSSEFNIFFISGKLAMYLFRKFASLLFSKFCILAFTQALKEIIFQTILQENSYRLQKGQREKSLPECTVH